MWKKSVVKEFGKAIKTHLYLLYIIHKIVKDVNS